MNVPMTALIVYLSSNAMKFMVSLSRYRIYYTYPYHTQSCPMGPQ